MRGGDPAEHAVCAGLECRPASCSHVASRAGASAIRQQTMLANVFRVHLAPLGSWSRKVSGMCAHSIEIVFGEGEDPMIFLPWRARHSDLLSRS